MFICAKFKHYLPLLTKRPTFYFSQFNPHKDYYSILNIPTNASSSQINSSFQKLSLIYHPDINPANSTKYNDLLQAKSILMNQHLRKQYDKQRLFTKFTEFTNDMNDSFKNQGQSYRYDQQNATQEQKAQLKAKRFIKWFLILLTAAAIFSPYFLWGNGPSQMPNSSNIRPSVIHRQNLKMQQEHQQSLNRYGEHKMPNKNPNITVVGQFVTD